MKFSMRKIRKSSKLMKRVFLIVLTFGLALWVCAILYIIIVPHLNVGWCAQYEDNDNISCGEESLLTKTEGKDFKEHFGSGKWKESVQFFQKERDNNKNNPEILIYLNNTKLMQDRGKKSYTIAVVVPVKQINSYNDENSQGVTEALLRGVAQVQEEFNQKNPDLGLKVLIVNDQNDPKGVAKLTDNLLSKDDVVAVIGHYSSDVTQAALPTYQNKQVVFISPTSNAMRKIILDGNTYPKNFFFRTVPTIRIVNRILIKQLRLQQLANGEKVAIFYNPKSTYSESAFDDFRQQLGDNNIINEDISNNRDFIANKVLTQVKKQGAKALILFPDGHVTSNSFKNTLELIRSNRDELPMGGGSVLYDTDILKTIDQDSLKKLVLVISWHRSTSPNQDMINEAEKLWGTRYISDKTAMAYDATLVLTEALKKLDINDDVKTQRLKIQEQLTQLEVAEGASGVISFDINGDRKHEIYEIVKVVSDQSSNYSADFVPITDDRKK